ncbi:hypothetical protein [Nocardia sp. NPDC059239]
MAVRSWRVIGMVTFVTVWSLLFAALIPLFRLVASAGRRSR